MRSIYKIASILILVLYLSPIISSISGIGFFVSNLDYIKANLCENRDKPQLACEGTCVLAKMLSENSQEKPVGEFSPSSEINILLAFDDNLEVFNPLKDSKSIQRDGLNPNHYNLILTQNTLDPPELLA